jgi:hypothetical protein
MPVSIVSFLLLPAANIPSVINTMANAPVLLDTAEMIVYRLVWIRRSHPRE